MKNIPFLKIFTDIFISLRKIIPAIFGWVFGYPFSLVIKRDPGLTVVISRPGRFFADNSKYFFIYAAELAGKDEKVVFLTSDRSIRTMITAAGGESVLYPSWRSFYLLIRSKKIVIDWLIIPYIYPMIHGAKLIQIWHGAPLKQIELDLHRRFLERMPSWLRPLSRLKKILTGRYPVYDIVVSTSQEFITKAFHSCFDTRQFIASGYPRNDILFGWPATGSMAYRLALINVDRNALKSVNSAKSRREKICLYVPTFRKDMDSPFTSHINLSRLSEFAVRYNILFIMKLHPIMHEQYQISRYPGLLEYAPLSDVYPLMSLCDLLITDYSSIYFDFLLLDRPIIFFAYDLDKYLTQDRGMYFDYDVMTPGAKCRTYDELESKIKTIITNGCSDEYPEMRRQVCSFTHDHVDNQSHRRLLAGIQ